MKTALLVLMVLTLTACDGGGGGGGSSGSSGGSSASTTAQVSAPVTPSPSPSPVVTSLNGDYYTYQTTCGLVTTPIASNDHTHYVELHIIGGSMTTKSWNAVCGRIVATVVSGIAYDGSSITVTDAVDYSYPDGSYCPNAAPRSDPAIAGPYTLAYAFDGTKLSVAASTTCDGAGHHQLTWYMKR